MGLKQKAIGTLVGQFHRPHGWGGRAAGWVMAHRESNRRRNVWAAGLLDVQPDDRVLEIGFGPGIAIEEMARRATRGHVIGVDHSDATRPPSVPDASTSASAAPSPSPTSTSSSTGSSP